ncbi:hypothetical protein [Rhizobium leguminosarum]
MARAVILKRKPLLTRLMAAYRPRFQRIAKVLLILVAVLIIILRALPLIGVSTGHL